MLTILVVFHSGTQITTVHTRLYTTE